MLRTHRDEVLNPETQVATSLNYRTSKLSALAEPYHVEAVLQLLVLSQLLARTSNDVVDIAKEATHHVCPRRPASRIDSRLGRR